MQHFKQILIAGTIARYPGEVLQLFEVQQLVALLVNVVEDGPQALLGPHLAYFRAN
jgi:hypothetical protein